MFLPGLHLNFNKFFPSSAAAAAASSIHRLLQPSYPLSTASAGYMCTFTRIPHVDDTCRKLNSLDYTTRLSRWWLFCTRADKEQRSCLQMNHKSSRLAFLPKGPTTRKMAKVALLSLQVVVLLHFYKNLFFQNNNKTRTIEEISHGNVTTDFVPFLMNSIVF